MPFDLEGARKAGYSSAEIADYLAGQAGFDVDGARKSGYNDDELVDFLSQQDPQAQWGEVMSSLPAQFVAGAKSAGANLQRMTAAESAMQREEALEPGTNPLGYQIDERVRDAQRERLEADRQKLETATLDAEQARRDVELVTPKNMSVPQEAVSALAQSAAPTMAGIAAGILTRNPALAMTIAGGGGGLQQGGATYGEAIEKGATHRQAARAASIDAVLEGVGEALPLKAALAPGSSVARRIFTTIAAEAGQEAATQVMQDLHGFLTYNPDITAKEAWRNLQVATLAGGMGGAVYGVPGALADRGKPPEEAPSAPDTDEPLALPAPVYEMGAGTPVDPDAVRASMEAEERASGLYQAREAEERRVGAFRDLMSAQSVDEAVAAASRAVDFSEVDAELGRIQAAFDTEQESLRAAEMREQVPAVEFEPSAAQEELRRARSQVFSDTPAGRALAILEAERERGRESDLDQLAGVARETRVDEEIQRAELSGGGLQEGPTAMQAAFEDAERRRMDREGKDLLDRMEALERGKRAEATGLMSSDPDAVLKIDQAAHEAATSPKNGLPEPSDAQKKAGNYTKGHVAWNGLDISIENPEGSERSGTDPNGQAWRVTLPAHYGYVKRTEGADGDQVDVYMGKNPDAPKVYVVDQINLGSGRFDEHKAMLGMASREEAVDTYQRGFSDGKGADRMGAVTEMTVDEFKSWVREGDTTKPLAYRPGMAPVSARAGYATELQRMAGEAGWAERGGRVIRSGEGASQDEIRAGRAAEAGEVVVRTKWVPKAEWFQRMRQDLGGQGLSTQKEIQLAADTWLAGKKLNAKSQRTIDWMVEEIEAERDAWAEQHNAELERDVSVQDLAEAGVEVSGENMAEVDAMATALAKLSPEEIAMLDERYGHLSDVEFREAVLRLAEEKDRANQRADAAQSEAGEEGGAAAQGREEAGEEVDGSRGDAAAPVPERATDAGDRRGGQGGAAEAQRGDEGAAGERGLRDGADDTPGPAPAAGGEQPPALELEQPTPEVLAARAAQQAAEAAKAAAEAVKDMADAMRDGFRLTGSDRARDEGAAAGQEELSDQAVPDQGIPDGGRDAAERRSAAGAGDGRHKEIIGDFGAKIGGARKDVWADFKDKLRASQELDIVAEPLSKSWPAPDYQAMLDAGADPWAVAFMHAARDEVPAKPRQSWKVKRWAEQVQLLRDVALRLAQGELSAERARSTLTEMAGGSRGFADILGRIELYQLVGHSKSLDGVGISSGQYSVFEGREYKPPKVIWTVEKKAAATAFSNWPRVLATGDTKEAALAQFKERFDSLEITKPASKETTFEIYSKRGEDGYWVGKKIGRNPILLEGPFKTVREARSYKDANNEALTAKLEKAKEIPNERRDTNRPRVGEDMRGGQDVTPQMFAETFGFRGVEFGNWVEQGKRQKDLNEAFDALMDMAAILDVPPRAISLNGELGLAFGARGTGGTRAAAAHYERDRVVVNLTKKEGAGSLGHEWWHALDNYFSRMREKSGEYMTEGLDVSLAARGTSYEHRGAVRKEMVDAFGQVVRAIRQTALKARSAKLDSKRTKDYWTTGREMSARAFESYLISKLQDQNASNDYLANIVDEATWKAAESMGFELEDSYPYPTAGEVPAIRAAFDHFFGTVETRETDRGIAMFSRRQVPPQAWQEAPLEEDAYITSSEVIRREHAPYVQDGRVIASSRSTPNRNEWPAVGSWRIDTYKSLYGRNISQLVEVPLEKLKTTELDSQGRLDPVKAGDDERYAKWIEEGMRAPPIEVLQTDSGNLVISDGHRRYLAAKRAGRNTIEAWVSYAVPIPDGGRYNGDPNGKFIRTGLTFEMLTGEVENPYIDERMAFLSRGSRRTGRASGVPVKDAQAMVQKLRLAMPGAPPIHIVEDMRRAPKELVQQIRSQNAESDVEAAFHDGEIYVFPKNLASLDRMQFVVGHHEIRHYGLRGILGPKLGPTMLDIYQSNPSVKERADAMVESGRVDSAVEATEEVLADTPVEDLQKLSGFDRLIAAVRDALRKIATRLKATGLRTMADLVAPQNWTDKDITYLVARSEELALEANNPYRAGGTAFAREGKAAQLIVDGKYRPTTDSTGRKLGRTKEEIENFWRWFGQSVITKDGTRGGEPEIAVHYTSSAFNEFSHEAQEEARRSYRIDPEKGYTSKQPSGYTTDYGRSYVFPKDGFFFFVGEPLPQPVGDKTTAMRVYLKIQNPLDLTKPLSAEDARAAIAFMQAEHRRFSDGRNVRLKGDLVGGLRNAKANGITPGQLWDLLEHRHWDGRGKLWNDLLGAMGKDGLIMWANSSGTSTLEPKRGPGDGKTYKVAVALQPGQIKSVDNVGTFDPQNPDIRFSRAGPGAPAGASSRATWDAPEASKIDDLLYSLQDRQVDTKRVLQAIRKKKLTPDQLDVYLQEELYHGRTAKAVDDFIDKELRPLLTDMAARKVSIEELEEYLHARHAEERNDQIAKVNPDMPDGGSGMMTADARDYLRKLDPKKKRAHESLAKRVDAINARTRQTLVAYRLEDQDTIKAWESAYQNYVPLMREEMDGTPGTGQGFSVRGGQKRATGSKREVVDILANIAMQRERAIVRGEKNRVSNALVGLAMLNPNPDFWMVDRPKKIRYIDERTGLVAEMVDPLFKSRDNVVTARVLENGKVVEHSVVFNERDERAMRMARALKNLDMDDLGQVLGLTAKATRFFASVNTQYNPIFGVVNLTRDVQGSLFNLSTTAIKGKQAEVLKNTLSALRGIYIDTRDSRSGKQAQSSWAQLWEEFQKTGGQTGYRDMFRTSKDRAEAIERELARAAEGKTKQFGRAVFDWLSDYNLAMENAIRLSAYKVAKDSGISKEQAASLAKNLTVNFNRKGQTATQAGALYAFFNASMQGTARMAETLTGPAGKKILVGGLTLGVVQALMLAAMGFDEDEPPDFVRERSLIIPIGGKKYITIPMPLGFHVIPNLARIPTEFALGGFRDPAKHLAELAGVFADAFNPIGNAGLSLQTIAPTVVDPLAALAENKDWTGKPIARKDYNSLAPTPGFRRAKDTASEFSKAVSKGLNWMSGGTNYKPGLFSPTPDQIDYLIGTVTGGLGREVLKLEQTLTSGVTGEDLPPHKIPLVGRFYGDAEGQSAQGSAFYRNLEAINQHEAEIKGRRKAREPVGDYFRDNPEARLIMVANRTERQVSELRRRRRQLLERGASKDQIRIVDAQITARMKRLNDRVRELRSR